MNLQLRALTKQEREAAFASRKSTYDIRIYVEAVRRMQPGVAYAIAENGTTLRATKVRFNRAAKSVGRPLRWAKSKTDAKELILELKDAVA